MVSQRTRVTAAALVVAALISPVVLDGVAHADQISDQRSRGRPDHRPARSARAPIRHARRGLHRKPSTSSTGSRIRWPRPRPPSPPNRPRSTSCRADLSEVAVQAFMGGTSSDALGPLIGDAAAFNEDTQRDAFTRVALNAGTSDSDDLARAASELADQQQALQDRRGRGREKKREVAEAQAATEAKTKEYRDARAAAERELGNLIQQEEERRARESYERMQAQAAAAQAAAAAAARQQAANQQSTQSANPATGNNTGGSGGNRAPAANGGSTTATSGGNRGGTTSAPAGRTRPAAPTPARRPSIPAASSRAGTAINAALSQLGVPYVFAAATPGVAFDCSGLTMWAWGRCRCRPAAPVPTAVRQRATRAGLGRPTRRPRVLLFPDQPCRHLPRQRHDGRLAELGCGRAAERLSTGERRGRRPARLTLCEALDFARRFVAELG